MARWLGSSMVFKALPRRRKRSRSVKPSFTCCIYVHLGASADVFAGLQRLQTDLTYVQGLRELSVSGPWLQFYCEFQSGKSQAAVNTPARHKRDDPNPVCMPKLPVPKCYKNARRPNGIP